MEKKLDKSHIRANAFDAILELLKYGSTKGLDEIDKAKYLLSEMNRSDSLNLKFDKILTVKKY